MRTTTPARVDLDALARKMSTDLGTSERRKQDRFAYAPPGIRAELVHPAGERIELPLAPRNLSSTGLSVLKKGYAHTGSIVILDLPRRDGQVRTVEGHVTWCRLVSGTVHELGIRFGKPVSPHVFCSREAMASPFVTRAAQEQAEKRRSARAKVATATGNAIAFSDDPEELGYIAAVLASDGYLTERVTGFATICERAKKLKPQLLVADLDMQSMPAEEALARLRSASKLLNIIGLTWQDPEDAASMARDHNAIVVQKPVPASFAELLANRPKARAA